MDSIILSRIAMAGWIFLAVFLGSLWSTHSEAWRTLMEFLQEKERSTFAISVLGVLAGIAAPPALGFLLERVITLLLITFKRSMTVYPEVRNFKASLAIQSPPETTIDVLRSLPDEAVFHVFFYTYADAKLLDWCRRRLAQVYASATGVLAILIGLGAGAIAARSFSYRFGTVCLIFVVVLMNDARLQSNAHHGAIGAWIHTLDFAKIREIH